MRLTVCSGRSKWQLVAEAGLTAYTRARKIVEERRNSGDHSLTAKNPRKGPGKSHGATFTGGEEVSRQRRNVRPPSQLVQCPVSMVQGCQGGTCRSLLLGWMCSHVARSASSPPPLPPSGWGWPCSPTTWDSRSLLTHSTLLRNHFMKPKLP